MRHRILLISGKERSQHVAAIRESIDAEWYFNVTPEIMVDPRSNIDLAITSDEYASRGSSLICRLVKSFVPTLHIADGIVEWRNTWENPRSQSQEEGMPLFQPVLSHKIACLGHSQARILESWGNLGKCEIIGAPRFDNLLGKNPRKRKAEEPFRVLIMTAITSGFTQEQISLVKRSLQDLKFWFSSHQNINGSSIEPVWRVTGDLEREVGINNMISDLTGKELAEVLQSVDAVITTPSTAMLEAMLLGLPVSLLDYGNCPHYVSCIFCLENYSAPPHRTGPA
jgi:hypothetical protein